MRTAFAGLLLIALPPAAPAGEPIDPKLLVGTWELQAGARGKIDGGLTVVYGADGTMTGHVRVGAASLKVEGTYTVDGDKVRRTIRDGGKDVESVVTISRLTATEMEASDDGHPAQTYRKVGAKK